MAEKIKGVVFIIILGTISGILLLGVQNLTAPIITEYKELKFKESILQAGGLEVTKDSIRQLFDSKIEVIEKDEITYYRSPDGRYIFKFEGPGLWGPIEGVIALKQDLETIDNMNIISQEETPGLGARIAEPEFLNQFKGKKIAPKLFIIARATERGPNQVDAVTGATMTSQALEKLINRFVKKFKDALE